MKLKFSKLVSCICLFAIVASSCKNKEVASVKEKRKPTIVFILADEFGVGDVSVTGSKY